MEDNRGYITIGFKYIAEDGCTFTAQSDIKEYSVGLTFSEEAHQAFKRFMEQCGYVYGGEFFLDEGLSPEEEDYLEDRLREYRASRKE